MAKGHLGRYALSMAYMTDCGLQVTWGRIHGLGGLEEVDCVYCLRRRIADYGRQTFRGAIVRRLRELGG